MRTRMGAPECEPCALHLRPAEAVTGVCDAGGESHGGSTSPCPEPPPPRVVLLQTAAQPGVMPHPSPGGTGHR